MKCLRNVWAGRLAPMGDRRLAGLFLGIVLVCSLHGQQTSAVTDVWLQFYGMQRWEALLDHDLDGFDAEHEFAFATDPFNRQSHPPRFVTDPTPGAPAAFTVQVVAGVSYGPSSLQTSTNLVDWEAVPGWPPAAPATLTLTIQPEEQARFYRFNAPGLLNSDGDCLLDFEELNLFHTDPLKTDTDGDGLDDCAEVMQYRTDPLRGSSSGRGAISGRVVLDEDRDPATRNHPGLAGWTVYLDLDLDGEADALEPNAESQTDGRFTIAELDPGFYRVSLAPRPVWTQIFPTVTPAPIPDGYPDRVVEVFDSGTGPIPFPYGRYEDPLPGLRLVFPSPPPGPVGADVVLGALPPPPIAGPYGGWAHVGVLAIPTNSFVTVTFDGEEVVDGPGPDLVIWCAAGADTDSAEVYLGPTGNNLVSAGIFAQEETIRIDLAMAGIKAPVRYVKVRGRGLVGTYPGIDLVGFEALHYRPLTRGHYDVTVLGGQTVTDVDFGVAGDDRPPKVFITLDPEEVRAGETLTAQVVVTDDLEVAAVQLTADGAPVALDAQWRARVPVTRGGLLTLAATATDTANQSADTSRALIARNEDGSLPDLSGLSVSGGEGAAGPSIQVHSPVAGEVLGAPHVVFGTIRETTVQVASWQVHYAPAALVNPRALDAPDADYTLLADGTGPVFNKPLGTLAGDTLPAGAYLLRVTASDIHGTARYLGFVFGVRVDPLDLRPEIVFTAPTNEATVTYLTKIRGSIRTREQLREWYVEHAPLSQVNLQNPADGAPQWVRIAAGTSVVNDGVLAVFDPTRLPNDAYAIRVSAWNENGLGWAETLVLHVTGQAKPGNFAVEFTDLDLPLAGIPVRVKRVYDSLRAARPGDFGHGWTLALQEADVAETVPQTGTGFASTPFRVGTRVYLTGPDGRRVGFTFQPEVGAASFLGAVYRAVFRPDPGVRYTLSVPEGDTPFLQLDATGAASLFFVAMPWNPDTYILTDPEGTHHTYDQRDGLIEIRDASDNRVTFADDGITHSAGPRVRFMRDGAGRITRMVAPDGQTWLYLYDAQGDLVQITYPGGEVASLVYSATRPHYLETINDPWQGPSSRIEYDTDGRVAAVIDAAGNRREQTWDPGSFTGTLTDARGNVTRLTYDALGNLTRQEDPLGGITTWEYKDAANPTLPTAVVDPLGRLTRYQYDANGNLVQENKPLATLRYTYDAGNRLTRVQYGGLGVETYTYDERGRLVSVSSELNQVTFTHTAGGLLASQLDGEGGLTRLEYDGALRLPSRIVLPDGAVKHFTYDAAGRMTRYTDPRGGETRFEYDAAGRLIRTIDPAGAESRTSYDPAFPDKAATVTDPAGRVTRYAYDPLGRLVQVTGSDGAVTRYEYDADGNRTAVVDPLGNRFEFQYDALGRLIAETDPEGRRRQYEYDAAGNRTAATDRNGRRRVFSYDAHNRLREERWLNPDGSTLRTLTYTYNRNDQLDEATDPDATINLDWMYVPGGPVTAERANYTGAPARRIGFSVDRAARRSGVDVATVSPNLEPALSVDYTRDLAGRLRILTSRNPLPPAKATGLAFQLQFWRMPRGDVAELRRFADIGGQKEVSRSRLQYADPCGCRLDGIEHVVATNQPLPEAELTFTRNAAGELLSQQQGTNRFDFTHDTAGQLTAVTHNGALRESYTYDTNGNRRSSHRHAGYDVGPGNRITRAGDWRFTYDYEGNLVLKSNTVAGVAQHLTWDYRNRLTRVERHDPATPGAPLVTEFRYDALDRRIAVGRDGHTTWTYYDGTQPLVDFVEAETTPSAVQFAGERLDELYAVWRRDQGLFWLLNDPLGTPQRLLDVNGAPVATFEHDSFGNRLAASGPAVEALGRFSFTGREADEDTGFLYFRARYYDPDLGRFLSEDPLGFEAGDANLYRYVFNRPLSLTDPTGMLTAIEYAHLAAAMARPGKFCRFAVCVGGLWSGVANAVINLTPAGPPDATCAAKLLGVPNSPTGAAMALGGGAAGLGNALRKAAMGEPNRPNPTLGLLLDLAACAYEASQ